MSAQSRYGLPTRRGDEFIIILTGLREYETVAQIAQKILQQLHEPFVIDDIQITTSFSIGISIYPDDGVDFLDILNKADTAMYAAKKQGRNTFRFFSNDMNIASIERINMENDLRYALENDQLRLYYQPQYAIKHNQLMGAEALLRWQKSPDEIMPPIKFMSVAEESGLIVPIGHWVLHEACRQNRLWHDKGVETDRDRQYIRHPVQTGGSGGICVLRIVIFRSGAPLSTARTDRIDHDAGDRSGDESHGKTEEAGCYLCRRQLWR